MKNKLHAFTLLELLAVISIISILLGLLLPAIALMRRYSREVSARSEVKFLETAWKQYYAEYERWPTNGFSENANIPVSGDIAKMLQGEDPGGYNWNPRKLRFMEFTRFNTHTNPVNPWGDAYYYVKFDTDYDNRIETPSTNTVHRSVIVWTRSEKEKVIGSWQ